MIPLRFLPTQAQDTANTADIVFAHSHYRLRITPFKNAWRIRVTHRHEDAHKPPQDFGASQPFEMPSPQHYAADGLAPLTLQLAPLGFVWRFLECLSVSSGPVDSWLQTEAVPEGDPHIFKGHPVAEQMNGRALGAGLTLTFDLQTETEFYALGERTGFLSKRGRRWVNWTRDEFFHSPTTDPLYQAHPFVLLRHDNAYAGLFLDESWFSAFDLGYTLPDQWMIHTAGATLDLYLITGENPAEILNNYTAALGRAPLPPLWALGAHQCRWSYPNDRAARAIAEQYAEHDLPLDALWLDIDYMDAYKVFTFSTHRFPEPKRYITEMAEKGIKTVVIVDPGVKQEALYPIYETGHQQQLFVRNQRDEELVGEVWPRPVVWPDFSLEKTRRWWGECHRFYTELGVAGIWNDMNEPAAFRWPGKTLPLDARQGKDSHAQHHNLYGLHMAQATYEGLKQLEPQKRPFVLTRSGFPGIQKYAWVWTGDNASHWEQLESSIPMLLNLGMSGVPFIGADVGGFSGDVTGELLTAWSWLGVFYPFMRNHSAKINRAQEPWVFGEPWLSAIREALQFRYELLPYIYTLCEEAHRTGLPLMRPLYLHYAQDPETRHISDSFLMGRDLLVAPALRPGQTRRMVYLPKGQWEDFWTGEVHAGQQWLIHPVSYRRVALFQRCGSAIPLQPTQMHTTDAFWPELYWRVSPLGSVDNWQAAGKVYRDAGEGFEAGSLEQLDLTGEEETVSHVIPQHDGAKKKETRLRILQSGFPDRITC